MKKLIVIPLTVVLLFTVFILWYRWDSSTNRGYQFGYYGEFNRVSNALASIPGITITQSWANCDVTLEQFGFGATLNSREPIRIFLNENDYIRSLSGDSLIQALTEQIETQTMK